METRDWESLPAEILEMIFKRVRSRKELFDLRVICQHWNECASSVLGQETYAPEKKWNPTEFKKREPYSSVPKWVIMPTPTTLITEVYKPSGERELGIVAGNADFPTQSLHLVIQKQSDGQRTRPLGQEVQECPSALFEKFGESLKYLHISGVTMTTSELFKILTKTPYLRILKIYDETTINDWSFESVMQFKRPVISKKDAKLLENLINLALFCFCSKTSCWLLETLSKQLVTLELRLLTDLNWDFLKYPEGLSILENLQLLTISDGVLPNFNKIPMPALKRLSIQIALGIDSHLNFIARFQATLVELTIDHFPSLTNQDEVTEWDPPCFTNLHQLNLTPTLWDPLSKLEIKLFSSSFPKLKRLSLFIVTEIEHDHARECISSRGYWDIIPSLQSIQLLTNQNSTEYVEITSFSRPEERKNRFSADF